MFYCSNRKSQCKRVKNYNILPPLKRVKLNNNQICVRSVHTNCNRYGKNVMLRQIDGSHVEKDNPPISKDSVSGCIEKTVKWDVLPMELWDKIAVILIKQDLGACQSFFIALSKNYSKFETWFQHFREFCFNNCNDLKIKITADCVLNFISIETTMKERLLNILITTSFCCRCKLKIGKDVKLRNGMICSMCNGCQEKCIFYPDSFLSEVVHKNLYEVDEWLFLPLETIISCLNSQHFGFNINKTSRRSVVFALNYDTSVSVIPPTSSAGVAKFLVIDVLRNYGPYIFALQKMGLQSIRHRGVSELIN